MYKTFTFAGFEKGHGRQPYNLQINFFMWKIIHGNLGKKIVS